MEQAQAIFSRASQMTGSSPEIDFFIASFLKQVGEDAKAKQFIDRALGRKGLFLYRTAAKKMQQELAKLQSLDELMDVRIRTDNHCFGCTAGMGSS